MRGFLRFGLWALGGLALLVAGLWFLTMPGQDMRGQWKVLGGNQYYDIGMFRADIVTVSEPGCTVLMSFPANLYLLQKLEEVQIEVSGDDLTLYRAAIYPERAIRSDGLPASCEKKLDPESPLDNFEMFWAAFDENYDFFDLHGVDWDARGNAARAVLNDPAFGPDPDGAKLRKVMTDAWDGLDDGHIVLVGEGWVDSPSHPLDYADHWDRIYDEAFGQQEFTQVEGANIHTRWAAPGVGLIFLEDMDVESQWGKRRQDIAQDAMEVALRPFRDAKGLIIDNRFNPGGSDEISLGYASWFTPDLRLVFAKSTRQGDKRVNLQDGYVQRAKGLTFDRPVVLLNSRYTESAAEIFTFAMRGQDHVTVMGQNTAGGLSDVRGMRVPNGWQLGLSHQTYLSPEGELFEGVGIPPDIKTEFDLGGFLNGRDTLMEKAVAFIAAQ